MVLTLKQAVRNFLSHKGLQYTYRKNGKSYCTFCGALRFENEITGEWYETQCSKECHWRVLRETFERYDK